MLTSSREAMAGVISAARNVSQPFGTVDPGSAGTRWQTVIDLTNRVYYFESTASLNIIWVRLDALDFSQNAPIKKIDLVNEPDLVGDVSAEFRNKESFKWAKPSEALLIIILSPSAGRKHVSDSGYKCPKYRTCVDTVVRPLCG